LDKAIKAQKDYIDQILNQVKASFKSKIEIDKSAWWRT